MITNVNENWNLGNIHACISSSHSKLLEDTASIQRYFVGFITIGEKQILARGLGM